MDESAFWRFSLAYYRRPGVADACLQLQDRAGVDVNVLLFLLFVASRGRRAAGGDLDRIENIAAAWRDAVVKPLRALRRKLKLPLGAFEPSVTSALRSDVKRIELAAERIQQEALERLIALQSLEAERGDPTDTARANLAAYAQLLGSFPQEPLARILGEFERYCSQAAGR